MLEVLDVAVIGGGPIGSRTALQLAKSGYRVNVLEKKARIGEKSCCSGIISRECATVYDIPPEVILKQVNSANVYSPGGDCLHLYRPEIQACILDRGEFDRLLANRAAAAGAEYYLSTSVKNISFDSESVDIEAETGGKTLHFKPKTVVIASGFNTRLTKQAGLVGTGYFVHGAQIESTSNEIREVSVYFDQELAPGFFAWIIPTNQDRCLVGLLARSNPGSYLKNWIALLESRGTIRNNGSSMRYGSIPLKPLKRTYGDRFLVVGDAAGQVKPTTGGGIYFGMLCADIAADTINKAFVQGDFSAKIMASYEQSWHKILENELKNGYYARKLYERLSNNQINGLISTLKKSGMIENVLKQEDLSFDRHGGLLLKAVKMSAVSGAKRILKLPAGIFRKNKD
jgi:digeranylgeranylglycerophospholipid reductase